MDDLERRLESWYWLGYLLDGAESIDNFVMNDDMEMKNEHRL